MSKKYEYLRYAGVTVRENSQVKIIERKNEGGFSFFKRLIVAALLVLAVFGFSRLPFSGIKQANEFIKSVVTFDFFNVINKSETGKGDSSVNEDYGNSPFADAIKELFKKTEIKA